MPHDIKPPCEVGQFVADAQSTPLSLFCILCQPFLESLPQVEGGGDNRKIAFVRLVPILFPFAVVLPLLVGFAQLLLAGDFDGPNLAVLSPAFVPTSSSALDTLKPSDEPLELGIRCGEGSLKHGQLLFKRDRAHFGDVHPVPQSIETFVERVRDREVETRQAALLLTRNTYDTHYTRSYVRRQLRPRATGPNSDRGLRRVARPRYGRRPDESAGAVQVGSRGRNGRRWR